LSRWYPHGYIVKARARRVLHETLRRTGVLYVDMPPIGRNRPGGIVVEAALDDETMRGKADAARMMNRLARIEGQVRGLQRMIEEGKDCEAVLTQLSAVKSALDRVGVFLISHRMRDCLQSKVSAEVPPEAIEEAFEIFLKYVQCVR